MLYVARDTVYIMWTNIRYHIKLLSLHAESINLVTNYWWSQFILRPSLENFDVEHDLPVTYNISRMMTLYGDNMRHSVSIVGWSLLLYSAFFRCVSFLWKQQSLRVSQLIWLI